MTMFRFPRSRAAAHGSGYAARIERGGFKPGLAFAENTNSTGKKMPRVLRFVSGTVKESLNKLLSTELLHGLPRRFLRPSQ
jgi:hypothetical protein